MKGIPSWVRATVSFVYAANRRCLLVAMYVWRNSLSDSMRDNGNCAKLDTYVCMYVCQFFFQQYFGLDLP